METLFDLMVFSSDFKISKLNVTPWEIRSANFTYQIGIGERETEYRESDDM